MDRRKTMISLIVLAFVVVVIFSVLLATRYTTPTVNMRALCSESFSSDCPAMMVSRCIDSNGANAYLVGFSCTDVPAKYYDSQMKYVRECGGMIVDGSNACPVTDCSDQLFCTTR